MSTSGPVERTRGASHWGWLLVRFLGGSVLGCCFLLVCAGNMNPYTMNQEMMTVFGLLAGVAFFSFRSAVFAFLELTGTGPYRLLPEPEPDEADTPES